MTSVLSARPLFATFIAGEPLKFGAWAGILVCLGGVAILSVRGKFSDVRGVLDKDKNLLTDLRPADIAKLSADGTISGGMIPKLETCIHAVEAGCEAAVVLDGRVPHAMLLEFFTSRGAGTLIRK